MTPQETTGFSYYCFVKKFLKNLTHSSKKIIRIQISHMHTLGLCVRFMSHIYTSYIYLDKIILKTKGATKIMCISIESYFKNLKLK